MRHALTAVFYGDDFTGASDNAAQYARHGLRTLLFFSNPDPLVLQRAAADYDVIGVAGTARSLATHAMAAEIVPVLHNFRQLNVPLIQYKCCSTFDSSPDTGSLGEAIRLMRSCWPDSLVPVLAATPEFGRYTLFGHHYARAGEQVYRLDRHPVMARHPVTPMHESDLALVLQSQQFSPQQHVDLRTLDAYADQAAALGDVIATYDSVVFDGYSLQQVTTAAASIWHASASRQLCAMAAQGFAHGLGLYLRQSGRLTAAEPTHALKPVDQLLVLSGSCSSLSAAQIDWAIGAGFASFRIDPATLLDAADASMDALEQAMLSALAAGNSVVIYTAKGPDDAQVGTVQAGIPQDVAAAAYVAQRIGQVFARLARSAIAGAGLTRLVVAGGDSSSFTMRQLGAVALEIKASHIRQNAHVCALMSDDPLIHGKEVLLKGGQVGAENLYGVMRDGFTGSSTH